MMGLTAKEQAFLNEYLQCWNASLAYRKTHPKAKKNTSWANGSEMLRKTEVQEAIRERLKAYHMSAEEVLGRLSEHARANLAPFFETDKNGFPVFDFSSEQAQASMHTLKKVKASRTRRIVGKGKDAEEWEDERVEVEVVDAQSALEKLGRHHKLFNDKLEVVHSLNVENLDNMLDSIYGNSKPKSR